MGIALVLALIDDSSCYVVNNKGCIIVAIIGLVISVISLFFVIKYYRLSVAPQFVHKELLNDLDEAEKEFKKLDDRLLQTPVVALEQCRHLMGEMIINIIARGNS